MAKKFGRNQRRKLRELQVSNGILETSVEYLKYHTNFTPLSFEEVEERIQKRWVDTGYAPVGKAWGNGSGPG